MRGDLNKFKIKETIDTIQRVISYPRQSVVWLTCTAYTTHLVYIKGKEVCVFVGLNNCFLKCKMGFYSSSIILTARLNSEGVVTMSF